MSTRYDDLEGKNVMVTGGTSGLGYAIAGAFAACRSRVVIIGRDAERLSKAGKQIGGHVVSKAFDLSDIEGLPDMVADIRRSMGEIDVLVNNAGINLKKDALAVSNREFTDVVLTNQTAVFALTREIGRHMISRRSGAIVMISSMASHYGIPGVIAYTASKSAVEGMTRALAVEWSPFGVRVNCIAPGFIATPMSARALDTDAGRKSRVLARTPMGKLGEPADVAEAALFLSSARARYITGVVLPVDGGNSIGF
ncbi:MAG TPA: glucose 1-dehydrogenase [Bacteroidota bacterium]|nr:glucose 1-dehydrogenase [Bacteroidota bacterium]